MRIRSLKIANLRAIDSFEVADLPDFIIIAGPNGCGKTTVLDALRLLKSAYVPDEWKRWLQEFGINPERPNNFGTLFRDPKVPVSISATIEVSESERAFLSDRAINIAAGLRLNESADRNKVSINGDPPLAKVTASDKTPEVETAEDQALAKQIRDALRASPSFLAAIELVSTPRINITPSPVAAAAFACFNPDHLGEIEFHSSRRLYSRESISTVNLNISARTEERKNRFLYDLENKYKNIKSQLSEEYISYVLQKKDPADAPLQKSIKALFNTFFPGKSFLGVTLGENNSLAFPVVTSFRRVRRR